MLYSKGTITFTNPEALAPFSKDVLYSSTGEVVGVKLKDYEKLGTSSLTAQGGSVFSDPFFVDAAKQNFRFAPNSPALKLGILPLDFSQAGRRTNRSRVSKELTANDR